MVETGEESIDSGGYGTRSCCNTSGSSVIGSSHNASASSDNNTGILLWMGSMKALGSVVTMVQDLITSSSGDFQVSHSPAKAKGSRDFWNM